jgi:hypothetical protein
MTSFSRAVKSPSTVATCSATSRRTVRSPGFSVKLRLHLVRPGIRADWCRQREHRSSRRQHPISVPHLVVEQDKAARHKCNHGFTQDSIRSREKERTSSEYEYDWYRRFDRPRHELLRQWCGHRAVTLHERLLAAEVETERLDILLAWVIRALDKAGDDLAARTFAEEHERDRITPWTVRPGDRPAAAPLRDSGPRDPRPRWPMVALTGEQAKNR